MKLVRSCYQQILYRLSHRPPMQPRQWLALAAGGIVLLLFLAVFWFAGRPILALAGDPDRFRSWVAERGWWGQLAFVGMMALQIFVAVIPGEPLELAAGYAFGTWLGMGLCLAGAALGSMVVFLLVRSLGVRAVEAFFPREKVMELSFLVFIASVGLSLQEMTSGACTMDSRALSYFSAAKSCSNTG